MQAQLENRIISSFMLLVDHRLQSVGRAFSNYSGAMFPVETDLRGLTAYATPFRQICNDCSISGANIMSGVFLNNKFTSIGQSGLVAINHLKGAAYFSSPLASSVSITASYAIKEFNIELTNLPEWEILVKSKYVTKNQYAQNLSGLALEVKTTPIIYFVHRGQHNHAWAFNHIDDNRIKIRCVVIADNEFQCVGATSILKNLFNRYIPIVTSTPFDAVGNWFGESYDYTKLNFDSQFNPWIWTANAITVKQKRDFANMVENMAMVDFDISTIVNG